MMVDLPPPVTTTQADPRAALAVVMVILLALVVGFLVFVPIPEPNRDVLVTLVSVGVVAPIKDIYGYFFGSSAGSVAKDATIATMASSANKEA